MVWYKLGIWRAFDIHSLDIFIGLRIDQVKYGRAIARMFSKYMQLLMLNKEMVTFAWVEVTFFRVSRKVSNNPEFTFNWVDYFKRSNQMYVFPAGCVHTI